MFQKTFKLLTVFTGCCLFSAGAFAQEPTELFKSMLKEESLKTLSSNEIDEIMNIRQRLGGGTGLELNNILLSDTDKPTKPIEQSVPAVQAVYVMPNVSAEQIFLKMASTFGLQGPAEKEPNNSSLDTKPITGSKSADSGASSAALKSMQNLARRIEELAADVEQMNLFQEADGLRNQASQIRLKTRRLIRSASGLNNLPRR